MVILGDNGRVSGSEAVQQSISARRTQSERKREKNRRRNERNKGNPVYQARKKARDRKRRNAKRNKRNKDNPAYRARKNAKKNELNKGNPSYKARKNAKKNHLNKDNPEYQERKNAKKNNRNKDNPEYKERKKARQKRKKNAKKHAKRATYSNKVVEYERILKNGHDRICVCCGQLFAEIGIVVNPKQCILAIEKDSQLIVVRQIGWIPELQLCITCSQAIGKGKVPKLCLANGLDFLPIPDELKGLTQLEHRLVSARIPFMQLRELRPTTQLGIRGNIVNVPIDIEESVNILPREFDRTSTIQLAFKRRIQYKGSYMSEWIRPHAVYRAAEYLVKQPLYQEEGIGISIEFLARHQKEEEEFVVDGKDVEADKLEQGVKDDWDETHGEEDMPNPEDEQTLLKEAIPFAPGEGHTPRSLLADDNVEELSFPAIHCGQKRLLKVKLSYNDIVKSEIRRYDRRCCDPVKLFFMFRKKEMLALHSAIQIYLKMAQNQTFTVDQAMDQNFIEQLIRNDDAYRVLSNDRTSPVYWSLKKRELMAMIRTLGIPTFFLTLSAAETRWPELIVILVRVLENREISQEEAIQMSWEHKCNLIRKDPVTCARYFDRRIRELFKLIRTQRGPFEEYEVDDFYIRIEFQHRGSPHAHCIVYLKNAPKFDRERPESRAACEAFIDRFISCRWDREEMATLYSLQFHKHTGSCKRMLEDRTMCRFGIPYFPMPKTVILDPLLEEELTDDELELFPGHLESIREKLGLVATELMRNQNVSISFDEFLAEIKISYRTYERVIRTTLKRSKIFLHRGLKDIRTNAFNEEILRRHRANMDLQFVLDPYACVHYILDYINKSNRGMSRLLKQVIEEQRQGNLTHRQKLYKIASKFINSSEVSAQEAVYILLSMPMSHSSRSSVFINTGEKKDRVRRFKSETQLKELDRDSNDVLMDGLIEYYSQRPDELEDICLADFASLYDYTRCRSSETTKEEEEQQMVEEVSSGKVLALKENKGFIRLRKTAKLIRYRRYQKEKEPANFYREKLMLYVPWRNEDIDLINIDHQNKFESLSSTIMDREKKYVQDASQDYAAIESSLEKEAREEFFNAKEEDVPQEFAILGLREHNQNFEEEVQDITGPNPSPGSFLVPKHMEDTSFEQLINKLNQEQRHFVFGLLNHVKTTDDPFLVFLTGGAGTGKSVTIVAIYQSLIRWYARQPGFKEKPDMVTVLLVGPTGKSAFHIGGTTIHSALGIPVTQNKNELKPMSSELKNKFRNRLWNLKVIIIDEVSMVGAGTLQNIHKRLVEIFETDVPFAGRSILFVGDLNQLRPVMDSPIFEAPRGKDLSVIAGPVLWQKVRFFRLEQIMRQKDDQAFAYALNHLATGNLTDEDKELFKARLFPKTSLLIPHSAIRLYQINEKVERYNQRVIQSIDPNLVHQVQARDTCTHSMKKVRDQAIYVVSLLKTQDTYGLPKKLDLAIGVRYMVSTNIDIEDGLVNGSSGVLRQIDTYQVGSEQVVQRAWIEFDYTTIGSRARSRLGFRTLDGKALTPITRVERELPTKTGNTLVRVSRCQLPLVICEAITIHKSQGQSYDQVVVDVTAKIGLQLLYTALSRARSASGLFLVGEEVKWPQPRSDQDKISVEMKRLEQEAKWTIPLPMVSKEREDFSLVIGYQNLPHLYKHASAVTADHNLSACDILCFVETHSKGVKLGGFNLLAELPQNQGCHGISIYCRNTSLLVTRKCAEVMSFGDKAHIEYMCIELSFRLQLLIIYSSPKVSQKDALKTIIGMAESMNPSHNPLLVLGDFNLELQSAQGKALVNKMESIHLAKISPDSPSTDYRSKIDYAFASLPATSTYESNR